MQAAQPPVQLYAHQRRVVDWLVAHPRSSLLLAHGMGTGKTITTVAAMAAARQRFVIVAPLAVHGQWVGDMARLGATGLCFANSNGQPALLNPAGLPALFKSQQRRPALLRLFEFLRGGAVLILDEAHAFKTLTLDMPDTGQSAAAFRLEKLAMFAAPPPSPAQAGRKFRRARIHAVCELADRACRVVALTGTPMLNAVSDFAIDFRLSLNPPLTKQLMYFTPAQFDALFAAPAGGELGLRRFSSLACQLASVHYVTDAEKRANPDWPYQFREDVRRVQVSPAMAAAMAASPAGAYLSAKRTGDLERKTTSPEFVAAMMQVLAGIQADGPRGRCAIYSNFIDKGLGVISAMLSDAGIAFSSITGATEDPAAEQRAYNRGDTNVVLLSPSAQEGVDLKGTRTLFILDAAWNLATTEQIRARVFRTKSHAAATYPFHRELLQRGGGSGWLLLVNGAGVRRRYRANAIPPDGDFRAVQFVADQTVTEIKLLLMTQSAADGVMGDAAFAKEAAIQPYMDALTAVSIEARAGAACDPPPDLPALVDGAMSPAAIYQDAYPADQLPGSPCAASAAAAAPPPPVLQQQQQPRPAPGAACFVIPTLGDGDCFFTATARALSSVGVAYDVAALRLLVADALTPQVVQRYAAMANAVDPVLRDEYRRFKHVTTMEAARAAVQHRDWWADEHAIASVAAALRLRYFLVDVAPEAKATHRVKMVAARAGGVYSPADWVIPLWYSGNHYENIACISGDDRKAMIYAADAAHESITQALLFSRHTNQPMMYGGRVYRVVGRRWSSVNRHHAAMPVLLEVALQPFEDADAAGAHFWVDPSEVTLVQAAAAAAAAPAAAAAAAAAVGAA